MPQDSSPNNVPSANQGIADSLAAPGRVGVGGTKRIVIFLALFGIFVFGVWGAVNHIQLFLPVVSTVLLALVAWSISGEIEKRA